MDEIKQYLLILRRHWLPASTVFLLVLAIVSVVTFRQQSIYEAKGQILLKEGNAGASALAGLSGLAGVAGISGGGGGNSMSTQVELIRSIPVAQETIQTLNLPDKNPQIFLSKLQAASVKGTSIVEVSFRESDPELATRVVNTVIDIYLKNDVITQRSEASAVKGFIQRQLPQVESELKQAESTLRFFKEQNQIVSLQEEAATSAGKLVQVQSDISAVYAKLAAATARRAELQQLFGSDLNSTLQAGIVGESPALQNALSELREVQQELTVARTQFHEEHPSIIDLRSKETALQSLVQQRTSESIIGSRVPQAPSQILEMQGIQQSLIQEFAQAEAERSSALNEIRVLSQAEANYRQRVNQLPLLEQQQRVIERQLAVAQATYEVLIRKFQETRIQENQTIGSARLLTPALVPESPISPNRTQNLLIGGVLGILLGVAISWLLESTDQSIKNAEDAKELLGYTLLGVIPDFGKKQKYSNRSAPSSSSSQLIVKNDPFSHFSEAFRMLQNNLRFMGLDKEIKVIVISSSISGEGKSTTTANLAIAIAQLGRRVLIVDADMRNPSQNAIWGIQNQVGLSSVINGQSHLNRAAVKVMENLEVLPAGLAPPNPTVLLDSSQMAVFIGQCSKNYDVVIIDSPPLTVAAETSILCKIANGLVFVVRPGVANAHSLSYCKQLLEQSNQNVLGMVINGVEQNNKTPYSTYKAYGKKIDRAGLGTEQNSLGERFL